MLSSCLDADCFIEKKNLSLYFEELGLSSKKNFK